MLKLIFSNTDTERFKILKSCYNKLERYDDYLGIINEDNFLKLEKNYLTFEKINAFNELLRTEQEKLNKSFEESFEKAKLYFLHFYKALYMAIERGELSTSTTDYYNISFPFDIPDPQTPEEFIQMCENLFFCDDARVANGGKYFANPSIGSVKVWFEKFIEVYEKKTNKFNVKQAEVENIENIRQETDNLIYEICYVLSNEFSDLEINEQITMIGEYGMKVELNEEQIVSPVEVPVMEEEIQKETPKKKKKKNFNQLQFSFFFPE